ncbi:uncharacterized protein LOC115584134 isoform X4 [Sparus aurata]|uniref:uncharacterized protein LOC115584134 isoform X4 n=1 Tax=Sparus aurata TaxID=8175 RepID=UPI0011C1C6EF|nr:uncharacterized protein LOC115584134 isoform X4 [Sparus aurata]
MKAKQDCHHVEVHSIRPLQGGKQCQVKDDCNQTLPLMKCGCQDEQGQSLEVLKLPSSISIRDFGLSLSESDQAETDFSKLCDEFSDTPQLENMPFIDDNGDVKSIDPIIPTAKYSMVEPFKIKTNSMTTDDPGHMACDSTDQYLNRCSPHPDSDYVIVTAKASYKSDTNTAFSSLLIPIAHCASQLPEENATLPFIEYIPFTPDSLLSEHHCGSPPVNESGLSENWTLNDPILRLSSPESVMSISDYRAMSPDSPQGEKRILPDFSCILDDSRALSPRSDACSSPEITIDFTENKLHPNQSHTHKFETQLESLKDYATTVNSHSLCSDSFESWNKYRPLCPSSQVPTFCSTIPDGPQIKGGIGALSPVTSNIECDDFLQYVYLDRSSSDSARNIDGYGSLDRDCQPSSPESQTSQCSFSFLELLLSEPIRAELMSQFCDYYLLYSGEDPPYPMLTSAPSMTGCNEKVGEGRAFTPNLLASHLDPPLPEKSVTSSSYIPPDMSVSQDIHMNCDYLQYSVDAPLKSVRGIYRGDCSGKTVKSLQVKPLSLETPQLQEKSSQSFIDYWFSKLEPEPSQFTTSEGQSDIHLTNNGQTTPQHNEVQCFDHKIHKQLTETCQMFKELTLPKPVVFNLVERPKYNFEFQGEKLHTDDSLLERGKRALKPHMSNILLGKMDDDLSLDNSDESRQDSNKSTFMSDISQSSPISLATVEQHFFSNIMTFGHMKSQHCNYYLQCSECKPLSPLPTLSDVEHYACLDEFIKENRPDSLGSQPSQIEANHTGVSVTAALQGSTVNALTYADVLHGVTYEKHAAAIPAVSAFKLGPLWPLSLTSDEEYTHSTTDDWISELRPQSPKSLASQWELRSLSPDSPVPQFRTPHVDYDLDLARDRSFTPESTFSDWEGTDFCLDTLFDESRPQSPESVSSEYELGSLSPDSPVPQFRCPCTCDDVELTRNRSFTPESTLSDWEGTDLCLDALFDESRPESPQSVLSDLGLDRFFSNRTLSPESVSSDFDFSLLHDWLADFRASSPESVASVEQHPFSSSMAFGQMMTQHCDYYLQHSECRPVSPLSTLSDVEYYDFCLEELFDENRPDSPDSLTSQIEAKHTSVSATASLRLSNVKALAYADIVRGITHEKHTSVVPAVSAFEMKHLWPLSMTSDEEYTHSDVYDWVSELRPQSPESLASQWELRPLSPDSPVPQFRTPHVDYDLDLARDRSFTPESTFSDWEGTDFCLDTLFNESRPQSPESVSSEYELRSLSPDSPVPQFRCPRMCDDVELTKDRSCTPESTLSDWEGTDLCLDFLFDESRTESPQSVLSDLGLDRFFGNRALSPESVSSDFDFSLLHEWLADFRASSPQSVASVEQHPFSSSMAFGQMMTQHCDYYLQHSECRPVSPLSTLSDVEYHEFYLEELFDENRPDSPDSLTSQIEAKYTSVSATTSLPLTTSKPLTYADIVRGVTHMEHEDKMPIVSSFELRPFWLSSMTSDEEYNLSTIDDWVSDLRPQSPESLASQWELRSLSPDSPVPQFRTPHMDYDLDLARDRSFTPESTFSDWEGTDFCLDTLFDESRPQSPESVLSQYELRSLSPDSPVPQFRHPRMWDHVELTRNRSFTPESTLSDWEGTDLCLDALFDESRPESPQSVLSDLGLDRFFSNRALSPESVSSDFDFSLLHDWLADFRASSPESVASVEQHHFSPSMAFGQMMTQHCDYYLQHSECRPVSPLSTLSDVEYYDFCLEELFDENRPDSPDSLTSQIEAKHTSVSATASLRLSDVNALTYADIVRGITHEKHTAVVPAVSAFELKHLWPLSMTSDEEYTHSDVYDWVSELRPQSPESLASQWELRSLSPDSPVPQFRTPHVDYDLDLARDRSFTPESTFSDWEGTDFCLDTLFNESRPQSPESVSSEYELRSLSPDSPVPQFRCPRMCDDVELTKDRSCTPESTLSDWEGTDLCLDFLFDESRTESLQSVLSDLGLDRFFGNRALSPESVSSDFDFSLLHEWLADFRASSPESVASVEQHPFSSSMAFGQMMTQHCDYYLQHSECRPVSPLSTLSDVEYYEFYLEELFDENRPDSPDSLTSQIEAKYTSVSATASLPLTTSKPLTYADIVRGVTHMEHEDKMPIVSSFELRPFWLSSMTSDEEYNLSTIDDWVSDLRPQSPESLASQWELRSLSPDSPVPQFRTPHMDYDLDLARDRSFTPESTFSDWEGTDFCLDTLFDESRPQSPESVLSQYELRSLSPDSPVPQFRHPRMWDHVELTRNRSFTPESTLSDWEGTDLCLDALFDESRPESPQSVLSDLGLDRFFSNRALSPESVSSDFDFSLLHEWLADFRASSPESVASVEQHHFSPSMAFGQMMTQHCDYYLQHSECRPVSPLSTLSDVEYYDFCLEELFDENRPDSPDSLTSQIEAKHTSVSATASLRLSDVNALTYADIVRGITHEKHTAVVPAVSAFELKHLWPLSMTSDEEYTHSNVYDWVNELRPQSPESLASQWELRSLSPDSPVPQFRTPHVDYDLDLARDRSFTPESTFSDWEGTDFCLDTLFNESRPQSPESVSSEYELRSLSPDSPVPQFRCPRMCDDVELTKDRSFTPESTLSDWEGTDLCLDALFDESRPESPQSVLSDLGLDRFFSNRALSPESVSSDFDFSLLHDWLADFRASSPESVASVEQHPFSSSMAFGQMMSQHCDYYLQRTECRPVSPLSTLSDVEYYKFCLEELFDENRPDSPDSLTSQNEAKHTSVSATASLLFATSKPLTYADIVRGVTHMGHEDQMPIVSSFELRPLWPLAVTSFELRPFWLSSMTSDEEYNLSTIDDWVSDLRPQSPESLASQWELRSLSPDSPVPQFKTPHMDYDLDLARDRSFTPESTFSDWEGIDFCLDTLFDESRPQSPESVLSQYELRSLSPDSPVPQFRHPPMWDHVELTRNRSFTPESTLSDWEGTDLCLDALFDESRPESLQSVLSDLGLDRFFSNRALSPESVSSDFDFSLLHEWLADFRASSPESVASVEQHHFSPSMAFGQMMTQHCDYYLQHSECRPVSPLSTLSDVEYYDFCLEELFDENRPDSPDSLTSQIEAKHTSLSATASLRLSDVNALTYADIVRGITHEKHTAVVPAVSAFELKHLWPLSMTSDEEYTHSNVYDWVSELRPQSPESLASQWELRSLSPDSPVPQFRTPHVDYDLDLARDRSFTPESTFSDWEGTDFCLDTLFNESRPQSPESVSSEYELRSLSPDSPVPQFRCPRMCDDVELTKDRSCTPESTLSDWEGTDLCLDFLFDESRTESPQSVLSDIGLDRFFGNRALSPESVSSDFDFSLLHEWLADFRASSPQSVASVEQHPFSSSMAFGQMMTQHCDYYLQHSECRPVSPLSTLSDVEYYDFCLEELFDENRPDSPDSLTSQIEVKHTSVSSTASLRLSDVNALTYADIVRGITHEKHTAVVPAVSAFELKHLWPLSMTSDEEYTHSDVYDWVSELRPQSPESLASQWELRSLSPDSPVPDFRSQHPSYDLDFARDRLFTPESTFSDWEGTDFCLDILFDESRPQSPESVASQYQFTSLSPDSPAPQFRLPHCLYSSGVISGTFSLVCRSDSGISRSGTVETRSTGPSQHEMQSQFNETFSPSEFCLASPEILHSDDGSPLYSTCSFTDQRPPSPESLSSLNEFTALSPDSEIPLFDCQPCYYMHLSENSSLPPDTIMPERDYSNLCHDTLLDEIRPDSPESVVFDSEFCESISNMPFDDEYTQSFLDYWMSELRPSTPQIPESIGDQDEVLNALTCGQNLPEEIVTADNRLVYKKVSRRLMAHIYDPAYDRKYVCDKVCNQNKSDDSPVSMGEPNIPPKPCQFENTTPDSKPLQDSSLSHSTVPDLTVSDLHPEMLMPPSGTMEREPRVPSLNNNDQSFFVRPPPWKAKNLD